MASLRARLLELWAAALLLSVAVVVMVAATVQMVLAWPLMQAGVWFWLVLVPSLLY